MPVILAPKSLRPVLKLVLHRGFKHARQLHAAVSGPRCGAEKERRVATSISCSASVKRALNYESCYLSLQQVFLHCFSVEANRMKRNWHACKTTSEQGNRDSLRTDSMGVKPSPALRGCAFANNGIISLVLGRSPSFQAQHACQ